jgi:hypothetical protein
LGGRLAAGCDAAGVGVGVGELVAGAAPAAGRECDEVVSPARVSAVTRPPARTSITPRPSRVTAEIRRPTGISQPLPRSPG